MTQPLVLFNIQFRRYVDLVGHVLAVFLSLAHAFGQEVLDLTVERTEIVLRPRRKGVIKLWREAKRHLLFRLILCHINRDFPNLLRAVRRGFRKEQPRD